MWYRCHACDHQYEQPEGNDLVCTACGSEFVEETEAPTVLPGTRPPPAADPQASLAFAVNLLQTVLQPQAPPQPQQQRSSADGSAEQERAPQTNIERIAQLLRGTRIVGGEGNQDGEQDANAGNVGAGPGANGNGNVRINSLFNLLPLLLGVQPGQLGDFVTSEDQFNEVLERMMEEASGQRRAKPAAKSAIDKLRKYTVDLSKKDPDASCSVCQDAYSENDDLMDMPCGHDFHVDCLMPWLREHNTCPVCRTEVEPEDSSTSANQSSRRRDGGSSRNGEHQSYFS